MGVLLSHKQPVFAIFFVALLLFFIADTAHAARLLVSPTSGTFQVDSTFSVSIFVDSEGKSINAFDVILNFPPDKLQLVSPSLGNSITEMWTGPPQYNNRTGTIRLQGGIPNGIIASHGLISELTFRAKQVGTAILFFGDESKVLENDGRGTYVLNETTRGVYQLILPPPAGPIVASETHPDQSHWYRRNGVIFQWGNTESFATEYSYMLSGNPTDRPDSISDGKETNATYAHIPDGTHYFHIKSFRGGVWGGTTHFAVNIDTEPPAEFPVLVSPEDRTTAKNPIILFETTDRYSGIDHYELMVMPLSDVSSDDQPFFIEASTRQMLDLDLGRYDLIVRAYDNAGNMREVMKRIHIVQPIFQIIQGEGIRLGGTFTIPWWIVIPLFILILTVSAYGGKKSRVWHQVAAETHPNDAIKNTLQHKFDALRKFRDRYVKIIFFLLLPSLLLMHGDTARAETPQTLPPPLITTISENISNEDIFYIGGRSVSTGGNIVLYLQNIHNGEIFTELITVDEKNEWFYRHDTFLSSGDYRLWVQQELGGQVSPPSAQVTIAVRATAIQIGASRLSLETIYLLISAVFSVVIVFLIGYISFHLYHGRRLRTRLMKEVHEAEDVLRHNFMILRRDIQSELVLVQQAKLRGALAEKEKQAERQLLEDLEQVERHIGKEIMDIEQLEHKIR